MAIIFYLYFSNQRLEFRCSFRQLPNHGEAQFILQVGFPKFFVVVHLGPKLGENQFLSFECRTPDVVVVNDRSSES